MTKIPPPSPVRTSFEWSDLKPFLAVARMGKITSAARRLGVEHSTISRRIAALEQALGARLFSREPDGYRLTPQGENLMIAAEQIEAAALRVQAEVGYSDLGISGTVRIGSPDGFGSRFLAPRIGRLADEHPDLDIQLVAIPRNFSLSKREADIAITLSRPKEKRLHGRKLTDYRLRLYASRDYLTRKGPITTMSAVAQHRLISYVDDLIYAPELDYLKQVSSDARAGLKGSTLIAQIEATIAGAGICVLPLFLARQHPDLVCILPGEFELTRTFWLVVHSDMRNLARVRVASDFIAQEVANAADWF